MRSAMDINWDLIRVRMGLEKGLTGAEKEAALAEYQKLEEELECSRYKRNGCQPLSILDQYKGCELDHIGLLYRDYDGTEKVVSIGTKYRPAYLWIDDEGHLFYRSFGKEPALAPNGKLIGVVSVSVKCKRDVEKAINRAFAEVLRWAV